MVCDLPHLCQLIPIQACNETFFMQRTFHIHLICLRGIIKPNGITSWTSNKCLKPHPHFCSSLEDIIIATVVYCNTLWLLFWKVRGIYLFKGYNKTLHFTHFSSPLRFSLILLHTSPKFFLLCDSLWFIWNVVTLKLKI